MRLFYVDIYSGTGNMHDLVFVYADTELDAVTKLASTDVKCALNELHEVHFDDNSVSDTINWLS
jgi:hypothetical protein